MPRAPAEPDGPVQGSPSKVGPDTKKGVPRPPKDPARGPQGGPPGEQPPEEPTPKQPPIPTTPVAQPQSDYLHLRYWKSDARTKSDLCWVFDPSGYPDAFVAERNDKILLFLLIEALDAQGARVWLRLFQFDGEGSKAWRHNARVQDNWHPQPTIPPGLHGESPPDTVEHAHDFGVLKRAEERLLSGAIEPQERRTYHLRDAWMTFLPTRDEDETAAANRFIEGLAQRTLDTLVDQAVDKAKDAVVGATGPFAPITRIVLDEIQRLAEEEDVPQPLIAKLPESILDGNDTEAIPDNSGVEHSAPEASRGAPPELWGYGADDRNRDEAVSGTWHDFWAVSLSTQQNQQGAHARRARTRNADVEIVIEGEFRVDVRTLTGVAPQEEGM